MAENYVNSQNSPEKNVIGAAGGTETVVTEKAVADVVYGGRGEEAPQAGWRTRSCRLHGVALVAYGLAAAYTQYFACVAVVMVYVFLLLAFWFRDRRRIREWLLYVAVSVICYVPWLFALAGQLGAVSENYWILPLTWRSLGGCVKFLMKPAFTDDRINTVLAVVLFAAYLGLWLWWVSKLFYKGRESERSRVNAGKEESRESFIGRERRESPAGFRSGDENEGVARFRCATAGIGVLAGLVAFGFAASFLIRPIFVYRYMIPAAGCFWLGFALCLDEILCKPKAPNSQSSDGKRGNIGKNTIPRMAGILITILAVIVGLRDYRAFMGEEEYKIRLMAETEAALSLIGPRDCVLYNFDQVQAVTGYYLPETVERYLWRGEGEKLIQEITSPCGTVEDAEEIRKMLAKTRTEGTENSVWFIGSFNSREDITAEWRAAGLEVEELGSFLLERYWFNLYKIS